MEKDQIKAKNPAGASLIAPAATVFISSLCIMVLELVAARLIARHLGSSLYTWTAVIGIVLAGISLGNALGGQIADRCPARRALAVLFTIASAACVFTVVLNNLVGGLMWLWELSWPARTFTHVFLVFMLPSTILGAISPIVAKMALDRGLPTGKTVGTIYAWGAIGSIAGTFAAGFYLIGVMGTTMIIWVIGGVLLLMGILYSTRLWPFCVWAVVFLWAMTMGMAPIKWCRTAGAALALRERPDPQIVYQDETAYYYVAVKQISKDPDKRDFFEDKLTHSRILMGDIANLQYSYTEIYAAITHGLSAAKDKLSVMVIGGGGYVWPRYIEHAWPGSSIDVVEIDPGVTRAAIKAFGLEPNTPIRTFNMDARNYVDQLLRQQRAGTGRLYDFVYGDAFNDYSVPFQLLTKEFNDKIAAILTDDGVYMLTLIDIYELAEYIGVVVNTLQQTFADVHIVTEFGQPKWGRNTFVVVAAKRELDIAKIVSSRKTTNELWRLNESDMEYIKAKSAGVVLTDDYAPVENLLAPVVRRSAKGFLAYRYLQEAQKLSVADHPEESIPFYQKAAETEPRLTTIAYSEIGFICFRLADYGSAVQAFKRAIEYNDLSPDRRNLARVNFELAAALQNLNREEEASLHFKNAAELFRELTERYPQTPEFQFKLGAALVKIRDFENAAKAFGKVIEVNPDDVAGHIELAKVFELQQKYGEGIEMLQKVIDRMKDKQPDDDISALRAMLEVLQFKQWRESQEKNR